VPESVLTILKFCFLALLYLFLFRVVRVVVLEMRAPAPAPLDTAPPPAAAVAKAPSTRGRGPTRLRIVDPASRRGETSDSGSQRSCSIMRALLQGERAKTETLARGPRLPLEREAIEVVYDVNAGDLTARVEVHPSGADVGAAAKVELSAIDHAGQHNP